MLGKTIMQSLLQICSSFLKQVASGFNLVLPLLHIPGNPGMNKRLQGTGPVPSCLKQAIQGGKNFVVNPATGERCLSALTKAEVEHLLDWIENNGFLLRELRFEEKTGYDVHWDIS